VIEDFSSQFYSLSQFLGGYFHQFWKEVIDWRDETPNFESIVRFYKSDNPRMTVEQTIIELQKFLSLPLSEKKLGEILDRDFGIAFNPTYIDLTDRKWLESILKILKDSDTSSTLSFIKQAGRRNWEDYVEGEIPSLKSNGSLG
jgi:hypothetical protein